MSAAAFCLFVRKTDRQNSDCIFLSVCLPAEDKNNCTVISFLILQQRRRSGMTL